MQTASQLPLGNITLNPGLQELLEKDELDWDNNLHREMYLKAWLNGAFRHV